MNPDSLVDEEPPEPCVGCGAHSVQIHEGEDYCQACYDNKFVECESCSDVCCRNETCAGPDGNQYCEACFNEVFVCCSDCSEYVPEDEATRLDDRMICEACRDDNYFSCESCGDIQHADNAYTGADDYSYCESCYQDRFGTCEECGDVHHLDDLDENFYCPNCSGSEYIHSHDYKPRPEFRSLEHESQKLYLGIELEIELGDSNRVDFAESFRGYLETRGLEERMYFKQDSSINNGFEVVTHPFTLQYAHKHMAWHKILKYLRTKNATSYEKGTCGLHIHLNRNFFTKNEERKLKMFFNYCYPDILKFSQRGGSTCQYAQREPYGFEQFYNTDNHSQAGMGRYSALNSLNSQTLEIRIFRGTLNYTAFLAKLQFADAVAHWIKYYSCINFVTKSPATIWRAFVAFVRQSGRYAQLDAKLRNQEVLSSEVPVPFRLPNKYFLQAVTVPEELIWAPRSEYPIPQENPVEQEGEVVYTMPTSVEETRREPFSVAYQSIDGHQVSATVTYNSDF